MQNTRDSSVWRTLAVAFGDGLAFGVGVTLTRGAARLAANRAELAAGASTNGWKDEVAQRGAVPAAPAAIQAPPPAVVTSPPLEAALASMSRRVAETGGQIDRRLVELEARIQGELDALDEQDHALAEGVETRLDGMRGEIAAAVASQRQMIEAEMKTLRAQMASVHKEFAETLARFMDEHIAKTVATRMQALEEELRAAVREEARAAGQSQQMNELRELMESQERNVRNLVQALGESCLKAASTGTAEAVPEQPVPSIAEPEAELPEFARPRSRKPLWRLPVVSGFVAATGGLLVMHYL